MAANDSKEAGWPREFRMSPSAGHSSVSPTFWTHELYRGPNRQPVQILYSRTKMQSEEIAHEFLGESVIGFDMEWPWQSKGQTDVPLQQRIGLIQIASGDKIGLFHIGLHAGKTPKDLLAPTLRKIIESEDVTKAGVGILNADFSRLHQWFGLKPRGAFELSHLHNLVAYGAKCPIKVTTKMKALSKLVEEHLGLPLHKGKVRTSNWSRRLDQSQIQYAAADAYAGLMLYHCMNAKRLAMDPVPPIPLHAETYLPMRPGMGSIIPLQLGCSSKADNGVSAVQFYQQVSPTMDQVQPAYETARLVDVQEGEGMNCGEGEEVEEEEPDALRSGDEAVLSTATAPETEVIPGEQHMGLVAVGRIGRQLLLQKRSVGASSKLSEPRRSQPAAQVSNQAKAAPAPKTSPVRIQASKPAPETVKALFAQLSAHRKRAAKERGCSAFVVARNTLLTTISEKCPRNDNELRQISGIGKVKAELYGPAWLAIVRDFLEEQVVMAPGNEQNQPPPAPSPATPVSRRTHPDQAMDKSAGGPVRTPPVLHTGISFRMENTTLEAEPDHTVIDISDESDDEGSAFGSPMRPPFPSTLKRKREMLDSAARIQPSQRPVLPRTALQPQRPAAKAVQQPMGLAQAPPSQLDTDAKAVILLRLEAKHPPTTGPQPVVSKQIVPLQAAASRPKRQASAEAKILRNKLLAFNRLVTSVVVLSEATIEHIIQKPPQTAQELLQIPNIMPFANACSRQNRCLLSFIRRSTQKTVSLNP